jgi:hypothetical protein
VPCANGATTTISGKVYDPARRNPLYGVTVYVPAAPLVPLPKGVPTGADACSCAALFKSGAVVHTSTAADGTFTLTNAPVGTKVPLVMQVGKWRRYTEIAVTACQPNAQPDKSLALPATVAAGTNDNMPDIAVSTGGADTLECLMTRIGLPASEYVAGTGTSGHVHVFAGGSAAGNGSVGLTETPGMTGAPSSPTTLWDSQAHLMPYDLLLLSCEGGETYQANPPILEQYLNAGGRALATHYHYAWFAGSLESGQAYTAPADWGSHLATWSGGTTSGNDPSGGTVDVTLNGSGNPFPKGVAFQEWLQNVGALGIGVPTGELSIYQSRFNAVVAAADAPVQPWITSDVASGHAGATMLFSFNAPVGAADGGSAPSCGRAMFTDVHVAGDPSTADSPSPPGGCSTNALSAQEKALEFALFDLSSCVLPDATPPPAGFPGP